MARGNTPGAGGPFHAPPIEALAPVYLFFGEEDFLIEEGVREMLDAAVPADLRAFNLDVMQGAEAAAHDIVARASAFPMMAERRAVLVREADRLGQKDLELLASYVERPSPSTVLILTAVKPDMRRKAFAAVRKAGGTVECRPLTEAQLPAWITRRLRARGLAIDPDACRLLSSLVGRGLRELDQELEKLAAYTGGRAQITSDDVAAVVGVSRQYNIFELQRAIAGGEVARAEEILGRMLETGQGAPYFVAMLSSFFAAVWKMHDFRRRGMSEDTMAREMKRERWMLTDYITAAQRYSPYQTERALALLLTVDERSKSSGGDDATLLQTLLADLMANPSETS